ncbi:hypothetical protein FOZ62_016354 [Perkinsus olseni]|uniref:Uncharacterized protein n=1 Tax=Perkinsus olseni TaxID=32597 RepID=A0A7J6UCA7_PEROL|nr:hypothetical protein FOZ62_016354 [Perkinsus olseni]
MVAAAVARTYRQSPVLANSISSLFFFALSDWFAQKAEKCEKIDEKRVAAVSACGPLFNGLPLTLFYEALDRRIGTKPTFRVVGRKLLAMQFIYMPISVPSFLFLSTMFHRLLLGEGVRDSARRGWDTAEKKWAEAYLASWFVWPVSDTFNFTVVQRIFPAARPTWDCVVDAMSQTHAENLGGVHSELNQKIITLAELQRSMEDLERRVEMCESTSGGGRRLTEINLDDAFGRMFGSIASTRFIATARNITSPIISAASQGLVWGPASDPISHPVEGDSHVDLLFNSVQGYLDEHISGTRLVLPSGLGSRLLLVVFVLLFSYVLTVTLLMLVLAPFKLGGLLLKQ